MAKSFDVIIVGAGPAGSAAALKLAQAGMNAVMVERGSYPGAKNMFGGALYSNPALLELIPNFTERAPLERHLCKKVMAIMTSHSAFSLTFENENFDKPPYNGYTVFRPIFDNWLATEAVKAGAFLLCDCTAEDIIKENGKISGVIVKGRGGELRGKIVIAADGVLSFMAKKAGLRQDFRTSDLGLGIKLLLGLPEETINERFQLVRDQGMDINFLGAAGELRGGGFLYTNRESISLGLVVHLDSLKNSGQAPYDVLNVLLQHPLLRKLIKGGTPLEYSAHLIPEGGFKAIPPVFTDGFMLAGDAAGLCYTNGINLEGINLAITSGVLAAETAIQALNTGNCNAQALSIYKKKLEGSFVLQDMKAFKNSADMMHINRLYRDYPQAAISILDQVYRAGGFPRSKLLNLIRKEMLKKVSLKNLIADSLKIGRTWL